MTNTTNQMIQIQFVIENVAYVPLFCVDAPKSEILNIEQAIEGERIYNNAYLDFGGIIYA